jgi:hypothetical protein
MVTEQAGKAVSGYMDIMKANPLGLSLVLMNLSLIGLLYYQSALFNSQRAENVRLFLDVQKEVQKLLSQCIVPPPPDRRGSLEPLRLPLETLQ